MDKNQTQGKLSVTGIVLAGGKGYRLGKDKGLVKFRGQYLIDSILKIFKELFDEIIISSNNPSAYKFTGLKIVQDMIPNKGPLLGIYSSVKESRHSVCFACACDMPFIKPPLIDYMIKKSEGFDVVIPSLGEDRLEPLHALYKKSCLPAIEWAIKAQKKRIISFLPQLKVYKMEKEEIIPFDPGLISFFNINTKEDLKKATILLMH